MGVLFALNITLKQSVTFLGEGGYFIDMHRKKYCLILNSHLSKALKLRSGDTYESQAEFVRKWVIVGILNDINNLDPQTAQFVLGQVKEAIGEMTDEELSPIVKNELLKILTPMLNDAQ